MALRPLTSSETCLLYRLDLPRPHALRPCARHQGVAIISGYERLVSIPLEGFLLEVCLCVFHICLYFSVLKDWINLLSLPDGLAICWSEILTLIALRDI